ncbi:hypothetical protein GII36_03935 [Candidatus Mycosynbacter amalyticus]|uniref:Uncharacterized protein n=1 Tax=Candidatus Mycosynbacter amalyticus TaxID=2665156 RepID=A0A857MMD8_9BACT|nr:hypothetical protein [Candidatus Mycosynbacter amalyticus]QHN42985.1 hypothetical protein GII36_03935 [Candidatus Mycosynbacter amalyticus]
MPTKKSTVKSRVKSPKKVATPTKKSAKQPTANVKSTTWWKRPLLGVASRYKSMQRRRAGFLLRRPHRSFQFTRRRDYTRSLRLPGYFAFTIEVARTLWQHKLTFGLLGMIFLILTTAFGLLGSQDTYSQLGDLLKTTAPDGMFGGATGEVSKAGLLLLSATTTGLTGDLSDGQKIAAVFFSLYMWLTVVWLLRNILANKKVKLRDGLYSAGAPILPTFLLFLVVLIQLVPAALAIIVASAGWQTGFIQQGVASMAAGLGLSLIVVASLYWIVSTCFALVVVTLPGIYPFRALAIAGDLVVGRRLRLVYRMIWLVLTLVSWWVVIMVPIILLDTFIKSKFEQTDWIPIVPFFLLLMSTFTIIWTASYVYLLYRKVVDDDATPA